MRTKGCPSPGERPADETPKKATGVSIRGMGAANQTTGHQNGIVLTWESHTPACAAGGSRGRQGPLSRSQPSPARPGRRCARRRSCCHQYQGAGAYCAAPQTEGQQRQRARAQASSQREEAGTGVMAASSSTERRRPPPPRCGPPSRPRLALISPCVRSCPSTCTHAQGAGLRRKTIGLGARRAAPRGARPATARRPGTGESCCAAGRHGHPLRRVAAKAASCKHRLRKRMAPLNHVVQRAVQRHRGAARARPLEPAQRQTRRTTAHQMRSSRMPHGHRSARRRTHCGAGRYA